MKAQVVSGFLDSLGHLQLDDPLQVKNQRVKVIVLIPEEDDLDDSLWLQAMEANPSFDFLRDEAEDIYSIKDGKPLGDEV